MCQTPVDPDQCGVPFASQSWRAKGSSVARSESLSHTEASARPARRRDPARRRRRVCLTKASFSRSWETACARCAHCAACRAGNSRAAPACPSASWPRSKRAKATSRSCGCCGSRWCFAANSVSCDRLSPSAQLRARFSTLAIRSGTPNSLRQTWASTATPSRICSCEGLAKHSRAAGSRGPDC